MPNLTLTNIATTLAALGSAAVLTSCTKQITPDPAKATEVTTSAPSAAAPPPVAATATAVSGEKDKAAAIDGSTQARKGGPAGATSGQMSCGAAKCSGEGAGKKK